VATPIRPHPLAALSNAPHHPTARAERHRHRRQRTAGPRRL